MQLLLLLLPHICGPTCAPPQDCWTASITATTHTYTYTRQHMPSCVYSSLTPLHNNKHSHSIALPLPPCLLPSPRLSPFSPFSPLSPSPSHPHSKSVDPRFDSSGAPGGGKDTFRRRYAFLYDDMLPAEKAELQAKMLVRSTGGGGCFGARGQGWGCRYQCKLNRTQGGGMGLGVRGGD